MKGTCHTSPTATNSFSALLARRGREVLGQPLGNFYSPESRQALFEGGGYGKALDGHFLIGERQLLTHDGKLVPTLLYTCQEKDDRGQVIGTRAMFVDITERKKVEKALRDSEERFRLIVETISEVFWMADSEIGKMFYVSPSYERVWGRSRISMYENPRSFIDAIHDQDRKRVLADLAIQKAGQQPLDNEYRIVRPDGTVRWIWDRGFPVPDGTGKISRYIGVAQDITERKKMEGEIRSSVARLKEAQRVARIGSWQLDLLTNQLSWSDEVYRMFEIEPEEFGGSYEVFLDLVHPEDRERVNRAYVDSLAHKTPFEMTHRVQFPDGRIKYVHQRWEHSCDAVGVVLRSVGTAQDVTELTQVRLRLESERAQLRTLVETIPDLIWLKDPDGVFLTCNPRFESFFGAKKADIVGKTDYDFVAAGLADFFRENDRKAMAAGKPSINEEWVTFADDGHRELLETIKTPMYGSDGSLIGVLGIARNITAARRTEESHKLLATAIEQAAEAVLITDPKGIIQYVNPAKERISGYSREALLGKNPRILKSGEHDQDFYRNLWATISAGDVWSGRLVNRTKDGRLCHEEATISPVKDASGKIVNYVAVKRDITEHLELSKQLQQAQKMEAIGTLAGGIAHDFNNLLQVTLGYSELLLSEKSNKDPDYADLQKIHQAARSGAELVTNLLTFSRKNEPQPIAMDLNKKIRHVEKLLRRTIPKMIDIRTDLADDLVRINADPAQIEQVLMNLVVNAKDAMGEQGSLTMRTETVTLDEEYCGFHVEATPGDYVLLSVSDTGQGMDTETLRHIFEPFYTTKDLGRGTGLGLAMVYGIVKQHGGLIDCFSEVGEGTTFKIYFPALPSEEEPAVDKTGIMPAFGTETVMLVDDEEFVRELGARILTKQGYTVLQAANGKEAVDLFKREQSRISLVILDLIMPEMGGKDCLKSILGLDPHVKALIASGYSADTSTKECIGLGAKGFIAKPFRFKELLQQVRNALDET